MKPEEETVPASTNPKWPDFAARNPELMRWYQYELKVQERKVSPQDKSYRSDRRKMARESRKRNRR